MAILQPSDIVDIGIEKEKKRRDFYGMAADRFSDDEEIAGLFAKLRDWEETHVRKFQGIRDEVAGGNYAESYSGEIEDYMQAVVDEDLYSDITPEKFAETIESPVDALERGVGFEKDAILFFGELSRFVESNAKAKSVIDQLIKEEQQHMLQLFEMKKKYRK